jgi:putative NADH-flavin reductase
MRVLVVGAHHGLGAQVVARLSAGGHDVTAFEGDVLDAATVARAVAGQDAVVSTLGPRAAAPVRLCATGTRHVVDAMQAAGVRRLVQVTGALIGHARAHLGVLYRFIEARVPTAQLADRREQERLVIDSGLAWTLLRPTRLTDGAARGRWRTSPTARVGALSHISRADVAEAIARALDDPSAIGRADTLQY